MSTPSTTDSGTPISPCSSTPVSRNQDTPKAALIAQQILDVKNRDASCEYTFFARTETPSEAGSDGPDRPDAEITKELALYSLSKDRTNEQINTSPVTDHIEGFPKALLDDDDVISAALQLNGLNLRCASERIKNDPNLVLQAIESNPDSFAYASEDLKNNQEFIIDAILENPASFVHASAEIKNNQAFALRLIELEPRLSPYFPNITRMI